jgi:hypothetical protein
MTSERLGEMFQGDSADMSAGKFPLVSMGGRAETSSVCRRGVRTPIGVIGNSILDYVFVIVYFLYRTNTPDGINVIVKMSGFIAKNYFNFFLLLFFFVKCCK